MEPKELDSRSSPVPRQRPVHRVLPHRGSSSAFMDISVYPNRKIVDEINSIVRQRRNLLHCLTVEVVGTFKLCNKQFKAIDVLPQRILTNPSEGLLNNGLDNADGNLICRVHDKLVNGPKNYTILDLVGTGTFGQVFRCKREDTKQLVAVKVIKNKPAYYNQGMLEIKIAKLLNANYDPHNEKHIVRLLETFEYQGHICLAFELLGMSLLDLLTQNQFRGLPLSVVQRFTKQILTALMALEDANIIHCDLKPENILLVPPSTQKKRVSETDPSTLVDSSTATSSSSQRQRGNGFNSDIKVIDFGSACFEGRTIYSYIQSRFYRSPEVLLGAPYTGAIDMWSLACVCAEMYLGLPLFPGVSQHNQLARIVEMLGVPPDFLIECKNGLKYFTRVNPPTGAEALASAKASLLTGSSPTSPKSATTTTSGSGGHHLPKYRIKTAEEFAAETNTEVPVLKKYLRYNQLDEVIMKCTLPNKSKMTQDQKNQEMLRRKCFVDFLQGLFQLNPFERWSAKQAAEHPFVKNTPYLGPFQPTPDLKLQERKLMFMVQMQQRQGSSSGHHSGSGGAMTAEDIKNIRGQRAPTNFGSSLSGAQPTFTPLQYAHRRLSDPIDSTTSAAKAAFFEANDRPLLKRGDPVHMKNSTNSQENSNKKLVAANNEGKNEKEESKSKQRSISEDEELTAVEASNNAVTTANSATQASTTISTSATTHATATSVILEEKAPPSSQSPTPTSIATSTELSEKDEHGGTFIIPNRPDQRVPKPNPSMTKNKPRHSFTSGSTTTTNLLPSHLLERKRSNSIRSGSNVHSTHTNTPPMMSSPYQQSSSGGGSGSWQAQPQMPMGYPNNNAIPPPPQMSAGPPPPYPNSNGQFMYPSGQWPINFPNGPPGAPGMIPPPPIPMIPTPSYYNNNNMDSPYSQHMASSFGPSSYGVFAGGSMQEGHMFMSDFGMALLRPDMDEQRRLLSQTNLPPPMWPPGGGPPLPMDMMDPMRIPPPPHMAMPPYGFNPAMHLPTNNAIPMAMSYDSKMLPRMNQQRYQYDNSSMNRGNTNPNSQSRPQGSNSTNTMRSPKKPDDLRSFSQDYIYQQQQQSYQQPPHHYGHMAPGFSHQSSSATTYDSSSYNPSQSRHTEEMIRQQQQQQQYQQQHYLQRKIHQQQGEGGHDSDEAVDSPTTSHKAMNSPPKINKDSVPRRNSKTKTLPSPGKGKKVADALADWDPFFESDD